MAYVVLETAENMQNECLEELQRIQINESQSISKEGQEEYKDFQ